MSRPRRAALYVALPGDIDDPAAPSGGNHYDRRVCDGLAADFDVRELAFPGAWPRPGPAAERALADALDELPDGADVLLDGLLAGVPDVLVPAARRLRLIVLVHLPLGDETGLAPADAAILTERERRTVQAASAVVATSRAAARRVATVHGLDPAHVQVAAPGVEPAPAASASSAGTRLLCVAAVTPRKGHDVLVEALARVADLAWECRCVGDMDRQPEFAAQVRARAADLGPGRFQLLGTRNGSALAAAYAATDLLILPSRAETYGMVVTEALARGVPVLASHLDGVAEAIGCAEALNGAPGLLVPPGDPAALAAALRDWLTDAELRERLRAAAAARRAALPGWDVTVRELTKVVCA
ncbi:glycosyltransferase involved in cell wall biosynthesis [Krasilnikovia cinnamomea]|uniref:Glycosyltransferase involved in cell wall biosynthesis n=1 Tax=Krasilnikovia cinnamomea TaxID=349313 RepID=A0A4Q7ZCE6_9ACTN|nr:glycosyltransferase family 4 protein [Krasilnikovia cinnamomea]RZU48308.1 glycosyltransferase involved in cell wall biosynthesis [Krasilnikovia cinnamomea]